MAEISKQQMADVKAAISSPLKNQQKVFTSLIYLLMIATTPMKVLKISTRIPGSRPFDSRMVVNQFMRRLGWRFGAKEAATLRLSMVSRVKSHELQGSLKGRSKPKMVGVSIQRMHGR